MMRTRQTKHEFLPLYSFYDRANLCRHLEAMAAKGWLLEALGAFCWRYRRIEPQTLRFSVVHASKGTPFSPLPREGWEEFQSLCDETGWELAADNGAVQIFYNADPMAAPMETDPVSDFKTLHRSLKHSTLRAYALLLAISLLESGFLLYQLWRDPIGRLSDPLMLFSSFSYLPLAILSVIELVRCTRWHRRCRAALEAGEVPPELGSARGLSVLILVLSVVELCAVVGFSASRGTVLFVLFFILFLLLINWISNSVRRTLQKMRAQTWVNRLVTCGVIAALTIGFCAGCLLLLLHTDLFRSSARDSYTYRGHSFPLYHDQLPLTVGDLAEDSYNGWSTQLKRKSSPLLTHLEASQRPRVGDGDLSSLSYELVIVKADILYDLCRQQYINTLEQNNDQLPEEFREEYRSADTALWGAEAVYQRYSSGEPVNQFLVCWSDRIAEIRFDWEQKS